MSTFAKKDTLPIFLKQGIGNNIHTSEHRSPLSQLSFA